MNHSLTMLSNGWVIEVGQRISVTHFIFENRELLCDIAQFLSSHSVLIVSGKLHLDFLTKSKPLSSVLSESIVLNE